MNFKHINNIQQRQHRQKTHRNGWDCHPQWVVFLALSRTTNKSLGFLRRYRLPYSMIISLETILFLAGRNLFFSTPILPTGNMCKHRGLVRHGFPYPNSQSHKQTFYLKIKCLKFPIKAFHSNLISCNGL